MPNQNRRLCWERLLITIIFLGLFSTEAVAASLDCNMANTVVEKLISRDNEFMH